MRSYDTMKLIPKDIRVNAPVLMSELRIGVPAALQSCMSVVTNIIIQTAVNQFGTDTIAAWAAFTKIDLIFWAVCGAFGIAVTTFAGQNYGAQKYKRIYKSVRASLCMSLALCGFILIGLIVFAGPLLSLFVSDKAVIDIGIYIIMHIAPSYAIYIFVEIFSGALRGIGDVIIPTIINLGGICLIRLPWILLVTPLHREIITVLISYPLAWAATALLLIPYYFYRKKKRNAPISL